MPLDRETALEVMSKFNWMAYSLENKRSFQDAVNILYGTEYEVTECHLGRMIFSCQICNKDMNNEISMIDHNKSGRHQKNLEKGRKDSGISNANARDTKYEDSIRFWLLKGVIAPVGLNWVEEYVNSKGNSYFKCRLCGDHGYVEVIYQHIIGKEHTERYIKSCCVLDDPNNPNELETLRQMLVKEEGVNVNAIRTIRGNKHYWTVKREPQKLNDIKIKLEGGSRPKFGMEHCSSPNSPTPGPSGGRSGSISFPSKSLSRSREYSSQPLSNRLHSCFSSRRSCSHSPSSRRRSRSPSSRQRNHSPSSRRHSRSPSSRRRSRSPSSRRRSRSSSSRRCGRSRSWRRSSQSPASSTSESSSDLSPKGKTPELPLISERTLGSCRKKSPSPPVPQSPLASSEDPTLLCLRMWLKELEKRE